MCWFDIASILRLALAPCGIGSMSKPYMIAICMLGTTGHFYAGALLISWRTVCELLLRPLLSSCCPWPSQAGENLVVVLAELHATCRQYTEGVAQCLHPQQHAC